MATIENIIRLKRNRATLRPEDLSSFVEAVVSGAASDAQIAAFTMATWINGMNAEETTRLTLAMRDSGETLSWKELDGPVLDKHSTGGVGDLVSLVLGPVVAAAGGYVPMISGRGLGHTGGTLDKLESIPGFDTAPGTARFRALVQQNGVAIVGQDETLAPADRRIYAVRDVTATVSAPPLMISSILSKKLAEGLDGLVLDIKFGSGAFSADAAAASELAEQMCAVSNEAGLACSALVTDMNFPLARSAGNALEVAEAIRLLREGKAPGRLYEVVIALCGELLCLGGIEGSPQQGAERAERCLSSGAAAERFAAMVHGQGGPADLLERPEAYLSRAAVRVPVVADRGGFLCAIDTKSVGEAVVDLGGGRRRAGHVIDPSVGIDGIRSAGEAVEPGEPLAFVHAANSEDAAQVAGRLVSCFGIAEEQPEIQGVVHGRITGVKRK
jgi:thymidine phosphorylase